MKVTVGVGTRHVYLTEEDVKKLFGKDYSLTVFRRLSQGKSFMSNETVKLKSDHGELENVRVLGPTRKYTQAFILKSDDHLLRISPLPRDEGDLSDCAKITLVGPSGEVTKECACLMMRHLHMNPKDSFKFGYYNGEMVRARIKSDKGAILEKVKVKIDPNYYLELHLDIDDANTCLVETGDVVDILKR